MLGTAGNPVKGRPWMPKTRLPKGSRPPSSSLEGLQWQCLNRKSIYGPITIG